MGDAGPLRALPMRTVLPASPEPGLDRLAALTRRMLDVPTALVTLVDRDGQVFPGAVGLSEPWQTERRTPLTHSLSQHVVAQAAPLVVRDARTDPFLASNLAVSTHGIVAYAGMPVTDVDGRAVGSLCAIDRVPREWTEDELATLEWLATACSTELTARQTVDTAALDSARLAMLVESMPMGYIAYDADWRVTTVNAEAARIVDATPDALIGNVLWDLFPATVGSPFETIYRQVQATGTPAEFEYFYPEPLNKWYDIRVLRTLAEVSVFFVDVTERHRSDTRAETILSSMPVGFLGFDETFRITGANHLGARLAGSTVEGLLGKMLWDEFPELEGTAFGETYRRVARTGRPEAVEAYYPEPLNAWYDVRATGDQGRLSIYFVDVSEAHRAQALLEQTAEHDRTVAQTLQQALLTALPAVPGAQLAARYLTAEGTDHIGGDWYDAVLQRSGALAVSVGDVCGHGIEAAAGMGQLRSMLRGFIWDGQEAVADSLARLDRAAFGHGQIPFATVVSGRIEGLAGATPRLVWSSAGHPSPLLLLPDGTVEPITATPELMLGVWPETPRSDHERELPPGSTLILYTDGLVESRSSSVEQGMERLARALARHRHLSLDELLDRTLQDLRPGQQDDDIAVLGIRIDPVPLDAGRPTGAPR